VGDAGSPTPQPVLPQRTTLKAPGKNFDWSLRGCSHINSVARAIGSIFSGKSKGYEPVEVGLVARRGRLVP